MDALSDGFPVKEIGAHLVIPEQIGPYRITMITQRAFAECALIERVTLPESIVSIGEQAFAGCTALSSVDMPHQPVMIGKEAFRQTKLAGDSSDDVLMIGTTAVRASAGISGVCSLPDGTECIADQAFAGCTGLEKVILPDSVRSIGAGAFRGCTSLREIRMPNRMEQLGGSAFAGCTALTDVVIPEGVTKLDMHLFHKCSSLKQVVIPDSVTSIVRAFENSGIDEAVRSGLEDSRYVGRWLICYREPASGCLSIRPGTVGIADYACITSDRFHPCKDRTPLRQLALPDSLRWIGASAFEGTHLEQVSLPSRLEVLGTAAFRGTKLRQVELPESVRFIGTWAFMDCEALESISIPTKAVIEAFAITGRKDQQPIIVTGKAGSAAEEYCKQRGQKYNLQWRSSGK